MPASQRPFALKPPHSSTDKVPSGGGSIGEPSPSRAIHDDRPDHHFAMLNA